MRDWIAIIERAYDLTADRGRWLDGLADAALPLLDRGLGLNGQVFEATPTRFRLTDVVARGRDTPDEVRAFVAGAPQPVLDAIYRSGAQAGSLGEWLFPRLPAARRAFADDARRLVGEGGVPTFQDAHGVLAPTSTGSGVVLTAPLPEPRSMGWPQRRRWRQVGAHMAAGLRLLERFGIPDPHAPEVEAVFEPGGRMVHAAGPARGVTARDRLRTAVRRADRARGRERGDPDAALALWEALVAGRWSLVDHWEGDGRRWVLAVRNDLALLDLRGLSPRERQAAELLGLGWRAKEIAYALGLAESTVGTALGRAGAKLGLASTAGLAAFFAPRGLRARLREEDVAGEILAIGVQPLAESDHLASLTAAEREVAFALVRGATYVAIAQTRGSAVRTVANQAQAVYRKLGLRSRLELAAVLAGG